MGKPPDDDRLDTSKTGDWLPVGRVPEEVPVIDCIEEPPRSSLPREPGEISSHRWLMVSLIALVIPALLALLSHVAAEAIRLWSLFPAIGLCYAAALLIVMITVICVTWRSWRRYWRLREVTRLCRLVESLQTAESSRAGDEQLLRVKLEDYLGRLVQTSDPATQKNVSTVRSQFNNYTNDGLQDIRELETHLLGPLDRQASAIIERRAAQVAMATALAPRALDGWIVLWQSTVLIDQISQLYAGRPGVWGTLRLLRRGMSLVVFAEIADLATQAMAGAISQKPLAALGGRVTEGMTNGLLMLRLGDAVQRECRPVPCPRRAGNLIQRLVAALANQGWRPVAADSPTS